MSETNATMFPPGRYGRRREPSRFSPRVRAALVTAAVLVVVAGGTGVAYTLGERYGPGRPYDATVERFFDITDEQVVVEFRVHVPAGETAICAVRARAEQGHEVGRDEIPVPATDDGSRPHVVHTLATSERPITGEVQRCWAATEPVDH